MSKTQSGLGGLAVVVSVVAVAVLTWPTPATAQIPDKFENLQVLPEDTSRMDLINTMKDFTFALGTRCWYCHDGEGDDLSTFNFASDVKPAKATARTMLKMVHEINTNYISKLAEDRKVTCYTCHRGKMEPEE